MKKLLPLFLTVLVFSSQASADLSLTDFVRGEIETLDSAFTDMAAIEGTAPTQNEDFILRRFWLRVRAKVGLTVPGFANFEVIPDVEMLWEREVPDGWETYKP